MTGRGRVALDSIQL